MNILGLDIGGAGIKASDGMSRAVAIPFPLWRNSAGLQEILVGLVNAFSPDRIAVTMTGELCDCFETKSHGVNFILNALECANSNQTPIFVWTNRGDFVRTPEARRDPWSIAAANWLALGHVAASFAPRGRGLLIDIGSTTTDILRLENGTPQPTGKTDPQRLAAGELVYLGVSRTPVCALISKFTYEADSYGVMNELFATMLDVFLLTGEINEQIENQNTADGRPATRSFAIDRLARMIGSDRSQFSPQMALAFAMQIRSAAQDRIRQAILQVLVPFEAHAQTKSIPALDHVIFSGQGEFFADAVLGDMIRTTNARKTLISRKWFPAASIAACAHSLAILMNEHH